MSSKLIHKKTNGGVKALHTRTKEPGTVDVGIIDAGQHEDSDYTVASIGFVHEFGSDDGIIPERSFIRSTTQGKKKQIIALQKKLLKKIVNGEMKVDKALGLVGEFVAAEMKQKIIDLKDPPNKQATIDAKGSSNPLIASSQLKNSITYEVNR